MRSALNEKFSECWGLQTSRRRSSGIVWLDVSKFLSRYLLTFSFACREVLDKIEEIVAKLGTIVLQ
jgi:hypothetical protein